MGSEDHHRVASRGCWKWFTNVVGSIWSTREMRNSGQDMEEKREIYVKTTLRELILYVAFLIILCIIAFGMTSSTQYYYSTILGSLMAKGQNVSTVDQLWTFLENDFLDAVYWEYKYNDGEARNFICPAGDVSAGPCPVAPVDRNMLYENRLLGVPRIRQLRVRNGTCDVHTLMQPLIATGSCYSEFKPAALDKSVFNQSLTKLHYTKHKAWSYSEPDQVQGYGVAGKLRSYPSGGSVQDLTSLKNESKLIIQELKEGLWIGRGTRLVVINLSVYNANLNLFCIITLTFELPASGGVFTSMSFYTPKLLRYVDPGDYFVLACEIVYMIFIVYYIIEEGIEVRHNKLAYFSNVWNLLDIIVIAVSIVNVFMIAYSTYLMEKELGDLLNRPDEFADITFLGHWARQTDSTLALCLFFSWIKLLKYISFNKTMTQLTKTLQKAAPELVAFGILFTIAFIGFAQTGHCLFGPYIMDYSTLTDSTFTLLRTILGDFNFVAMQEVEPILAPIFFTFYVLSVFFVMLNMFLAIINDTFCEVKAELEAQQIVFSVSDYIARGYSNVKGRFGGARNRSEDIEYALMMAGEDGSLSYEEIRQHLKRANFSDLEIEIFFARFNEDDDDQLDLKEAEKAAEALEKDTNINVDDKEIDIGDNIPTYNVINDEDVMNMRHRIDFVEERMGDIGRKLDIIMRQMATDEKRKSEQRNKMDEIFDPKRRFSSVVEKHTKEGVNSEADPESEA